MQEGDSLWVCWNFGSAADRECGDELRELLKKTVEDSKCKQTVGDIYEMRLDPAVSTGNLLTSAGLKWDELTPNYEEYDDE